MCGVGNEPVRTDFDLLMFGHFAVDRIIVDGVAETVSGGGVYYGSVAARRLGARVGVVTRLREADFPRLEELRAEGVTVFAAPAPETSGIANYYNSADMERRVCVPLGFAGPIRSEDLPFSKPGFSEKPGLEKGEKPGLEVGLARIYAITPIIAGEVDLPLLKTLAGRGPVALDVQGFVRVRVGDELLFRPWPEMAEGLRHVTYLKVDRAEAEALTGETDLAGRSAQAGRVRPQGDRPYPVSRRDRLCGWRSCTSRRSPRARWPAAPAAATPVSPPTSPNASRPPRLRRVGGRAS